MISQADCTRPPHVAAWLITLFGRSQKAESVPGDLMEQYSHLCSQSGVAFARSWYWRQILKTIADLMVEGFRAAPWPTIAAILGGWLLHGFLHGLLNKAMLTATDKYLLYWSNHFKLYIFLGKVSLIAHLIASTLVGAIVGFAARGREMFATMTLSLVLGAMGVIGYLVLVVAGGKVSHFIVHPVFWGVVWYFADLCAIVVGGAVVRMSRIRRQLGPSDAQLQSGS
jgi:hypothetical protein